MPRSATLHGQEFGQIEESVGILYMATLTFLTVLLLSSWSVLWDGSSLQPEAETKNRSGEACAISRLCHRRLLVSKNELAFGLGLRL